VARITAILLRAPADPPSRFALRRTSKQAGNQTLMKGIEQVGPGLAAARLGAVAQDGPGFVWTPGGGLTPVGPRVDRTAQSQSPDKRDLLLGLTIYELAGLVSDPAQRQMIQRLSADLMRSAVQGITARTG